MTTFIDPPPAYGRILRDASGRILRIVEEKDASAAEKKITEVNTSHYVFKAEAVFPLLSRLNAENAQGEYYLTDIVQLLVQEGSRVETLTADDPDVLIGINSRIDLSRASQTLQEKIVRKHMQNGVTIVHPSSVYIEPDVKIGTDTVVHPFCFLTGKTSVGKRCIIGPQVKLVDAKIGDGCTVEFSVIKRRKIENGAAIGPFASIES